MKNKDFSRENTDINFILNFEVCLLPNTDLLGVVSKPPVSVYRRNSMSGVNTNFGDSMTSGYDSKNDILVETGPLRDN